ncbi:MAG TPA: type II secretion system minor pseudopilin GspK [Steroidobacteraceae bacterium]
MRRQHGMALITALVLVAMATILATAIAFRSTLTARRGIAIFTMTQSMRFGEAAEAMAAYVLQQAVQQASITTPNQEWAQPYGPIQMDENTTLEAQLEDEQGKFNINHLLGAQGVVAPESESLAEFRRLLTELQIDPGIASQVADWIDADSVPTQPDGAEDSTYLAMTPAYRTPNIPVSSISELLALPGMTRAIYDRLSPYITALPVSTQLNVCTASGPVLDAMLGQIEYSTNPDQLQALRTQANGCFPDLGYLQRTYPNLWTKLQPNVADTSQYFRLRTWIALGTTQFTLYSLIQRNSGTNIHVILRTFGTE